MNTATCLKPAAKLFNLVSLVVGLHEETDDATQDCGVDRLFTVQTTPNQSYFSHSVTNDFSPALIEPYENVKCYSLLTPTLGGSAPSGSVKQVMYVEVDGGKSIYQIAHVCHLLNNHPYASSLAIKNCSEMSLDDLVDALAADFGRYHEGLLERRNVESAYIKARLKDFQALREAGAMR